MAETVLNNIKSCGFNSFFIPIFRKFADIIGKIRHRYLCLKT
ncbi:hypothetical protein HMPREF0663_10967 [Hoylesella oralis ATCC 33269]|uniref:Uncharacterized protein n=1 Tax=Hoylesella oralis ATCC 33269 TaxID=873533 RepID=E7RP66_9BACT|nr:hypothetical protein HMPREF0663_10967 [Hoylesella oralis ATCC 33269]